MSDIHDPAVKLTDANEALALLKAGNQRYVSGEHHNYDFAAYRAQLSGGKGQRPFAVVITCGDSRVCPEHIFDQGIGDIFVCRNAGNILDEGTMGSAEFGHAACGAPLVVVLGHSECGAVSNAFDGTTGLPDALQGILVGIQKTIAGSPDKPAATIANLNDQLNRLKSNPVFDDAVVMGAIYDLGTGVVSWQ